MFFCSVLLFSLAVWALYNRRSRPNYTQQAALSSVSTADEGARSPSFLRGYHLLQVSMKTDGSRMNGTIHFVSNILNTHRDWIFTSRIQILTETVGLDPVRIVVEYMFPLSTLPLVYIKSGSMFVLVDPGAYSTSDCYVFMGTPRTLLTTNYDGSSDMFSRTNISKKVILFLFSFRNNRASRL